MILSKFFSVNLILSVTILVACSLLSFNVLAAGKNDIFTRFKKPMPDIKLMEEKDFITTTKPVKNKPYGLDVLEYTMRIPKGWSKREDQGSSNFILNEKIFLDLDVFYSKPKPGGRSRIEIEALNAEGNLTAEQWYLKYILKSGFIMEGFVTYNENRVESLMVTIDDGRSYYVRTLVLLNGDKVIMVKYSIPAIFIKEKVALQAQVIESFQLVNKIEKASMKMSLYRFLDIAQIKYPSSWKVYSKPLRTVKRMEVSLVNVHVVKSTSGKKDSSSTEGRLKINLVAASANETLVSEIKNYKKKIEASGMLIGDKIDVEDKFVYNDDIDFAITEVYEGVDSSNNLSDYEFWFTVMVGGNYYFFFMLLTPSRNDMFGVWAENTQSYKAILKNFEPMSGAFLERDY